MDQYEVAKRAAKRLLKSSHAEALGITKLHQAQAFFAEMCGYKDWHALEGHLSAPGSAPAGRAPSSEISGEQSTEDHGQSYVTFGDLKKLKLPDSTRLTAFDQVFVSPPAVA